MQQQFVIIEKAHLQTEDNGMSMNEKSDIIMQALRSLGYQNPKNVRIDNLYSEITNVYVDDEYFGIFDFTRMTFID